MITINELKEVFESIFERELDLATLTEDTNLFDDLGMNSIGMIYMSITLEEKYNIKFENEDFIAIKTIGDVIRLINNK